MAEGAFHRPDAIRRAASHRSSVAPVRRLADLRQERHSSVHANLRMVLVATAMMCAARSAAANVITDRVKLAIAAVVIDAAIAPA